MAGVLESIGYACAEDPSDADVLIYNTCSIREKAEQKVYSALGKQVHLMWAGGMCPYFPGWAGFPREKVGQKVHCTLGKQVGCEEWEIPLLGLGWVLQQPARRALFQRPHSPTHPPHSPHPSTATLTHTFPDTAPPPRHAGQAQAAAHGRPQDCGGGVCGGAGGAGAAAPGAGAGPGDGPPPRQPPGRAAGARGAGQPGAPRCAVLR